MLKEEVKGVWGLNRKKIHGGVDNLESLKRHSKFPPTIYFQWSPHHVFTKLIIHGG